VVIVLDILLIELVNQEDVDSLYETATIMGVAKEEVGVPFMLVGEKVLMGSDQILRELPGLIETHLAGGGIDYPQYPSLESYLPEEVNAEINGQTSASQVEKVQSLTSSLIQDQEGGSIAYSEDTQSNGFLLAMVVLVGMVLAIIYVIYALLKGSDREVSPRSNWIDWLIPVLAVAGLGVSGYLTYVETQSVQAICGPVGDCNAVQSSSYARVLGILPLGILGLLGYAAILLAWIIQKVQKGKWGDYAKLAMLGMALFGTLYSIYLTYVEIWVIKAVCMWCLSSAVLIALLMLLSVPPANEALDSLGGDDLD
jgi:uncharacterized membrane protein